MTPPKPPELTPDEWRALEGTSTPDDERRLARVLDADPQRRAAFERDREAMALWREDARRVADAAGTATLAERVLARLGRGTRPVFAAAPRYAAAALVMLAIGVAGTATVRAGRSAAPPPLTIEERRGLADIDTAVLDTIASQPDLWPSPRTVPGTPETER